MADCGINGGMCKEPARPYDGKIPLEVLVEREKVRPQQGTGDLWQAAEAGLQFFRMLDTANLAGITAQAACNWPCMREPLMYLRFVFSSRMSTKKRAYLRQSPVEIDCGLEDATTLAPNAVGP